MTEEHFVIAGLIVLVTLLSVLVVIWYNIAKGWERLYYDAKADLNEARFEIREFHL